MNISRPIGTPIWPADWRGAKHPHEACLSIFVDNIILTSRVMSKSHLKSALSG